MFKASEQANKIPERPEDYIDLWCTCVDIIESAKCEGSVTSEFGVRDLKTN